MKRILLAAALIAVTFPALAQSTARPRPPGTVPLEEPPPPPPMIQGDAASMEPEVTVRTEGDQQVEEFRFGGKLFAQRITPKGGKPYVLMDYKGDGTFMKQDNPLDTGVRVPQWVILEW
jgi:hypothetical protein